MATDPAQRGGADLDGGRPAAGFWALADPKISLASMSSIFLGACAAAADGPLAPGWLALTVLGIFALEVAKNASGEIYDYDSGTDARVAEEDRSPFSGGKRVLVDRLLTRGQTVRLALACYLLAIAAGLWIVVGREPRVVWPGILGVACAFFYHAPPLRLSYRGLGELAVMICYGPIICGGTYLVQRGSLPPEPLEVSVPLGLLIAAFLWINEFPDYDADRSSGKLTWVVRLGRRRASVIFAFLVATALAVAVALPPLGLPRSAWLGLVAFLPAGAAARTLLTHPETTARIVPAQSQILLAFVLFALGTGIGLLPLWPT